jgi:malate dehydrogenase (oxaloacetate-decarboxylating)(NADP+)
MRLASFPLSLSQLNAFRLLEDTREHFCTFNDDIQGTAAVCLAGIIAGLPISSHPRVSDHIFLFTGAGEAGVGIAELIASYIAVESGISIEEARTHIYLTDSRGLVVRSRIESLAHHKVRCCSLFGGLVNL